MLSFENELWLAGHTFVAGVDEAGRGPLAGPVDAAAVIFPADVKIEKLTDSKKLTATQRDEFFEIIHEKALAVGHCSVTAEVIDKINILQAAKLAMIKAVEKLRRKPEWLLIDGNQKIAWEGFQKTIVKGDSLSLSIAAASVIAKVTRDRAMEEYARRYPEYGFDKHKGYGVAEHLAAIKRHGPCPIHRKTFKGVREHIVSDEPADFETQLNLSIK